MKALAILVLSLSGVAFAQDAREQLGVGTSSEVRGEHPLAAIEALHPALLKPELSGVHPRLFFTDHELDGLRAKARASSKAIWQRALANNLCLKIEPAPAPAQRRRDQNDTALAMAEAAFMYRIEGNPIYLAAAKKFMDAAVSYPVWGYTSNKPNVDLAAGHLLYGLGWAYDLLYNDLSEAERARYRDKIAVQGHLLFASYELKPGRTFTYSQNHLFIPAAGLGIAAYAVYGEVPEAAAWARRARALYDRVLATYSPDGCYYEGFEYWVFATPWIVHYLDALAHCTGEDLFDQPGLRRSYAYVAHTMLPDGKNVVDFGDVFEGGRTRQGIGEDVLRTHPNGHLHSNYSVLFRLAQRFQDPNAQGVAEWLERLGQVNFEDYWSLAWHDDGLRAVPIEDQPTWHYFPDEEVAVWRSSWRADASLIAVKCGPPEGHKAAVLERRYPDWRREDGHAHPDAGSFVLYGGGHYLIGETGYAGVPVTADQNTLIIDGRGQASEGKGHNAFDGYPYARLDQLRLENLSFSGKGAHIEADATTAYAASFGLTRFHRTFELTGQTLTVSDTVSSTASHDFSILFHADGKTMPPSLTLAIDEPAGAIISTKPEMLIAAGPPGHVDQGPREERGTVLSVAAPKPSTIVEFKTRLSWK